AADETPAQPISDTQDSGANQRIAQRIRDIFGEIPALAEVRVDANEGVVSLSGVVSEDSDIARAETIASRIEGVVTVENALERDVSVEDGLTIFQKLGDRAGDLIKLLPLLLLSVLVGLAISVFGYLVAGFGGLWRKIAPNAFLAELIQSAIRFAFLIGGVVIGLDILGATALLGAVLGGAGVIGLALGFAMRDTVENYVASLMLSLRHPFRANDHVLIDDMEGRVIRLTSRATVLMTLDGNHLRIPNSAVFKGVILNYTTNPQRRFSFELGIDADDDPDAARRLGRAKLDELDFVLSDPGPEARTLEVGDSNIVIRFLGWVDQSQADWHKARSRAIAVVKTALEEAGFALPEPIYRLRFDARSEALPFANVDAAVVDDAKGKEAERVKKAHSANPVAGSASDDDVAPEDEVARMVDSERAESCEETDLLDSGRPVE
ncbi:mechanosensitive ion channel, partial [Sphingomonadaceae bacterium]|nr:mechanosensitive ion channel [Sphingomonadaceae bacterium]